MSEQALDFGSHIGEYRLVREVGRGAMGVVYEAESPAGEVVALKVLVPSPLLSEVDRTALYQRFLREARSLSRVDHPNVVRIHEVGEAAGRPYLAMEFLDGENLRGILTRSGPLPPEFAAAIGGQLLEALEAVHHAGIVHRDVKPENVVVLRDGRVKLADFGIARVESEATLTRTGGILGSPAYMSPEQILGKPVDRRSDLFSTAVTLYQLLADRLPFAGGSLMEMAHNVAYSDPQPLPAGVPYALTRVVLQGLQKTPAARYMTAREFHTALIQSMASRSRRPAAAAVAQQATSAPATASPALAALAATMLDTQGCCARHPRQASVGQCLACHRPLCRTCARRDRPPYYCYLHTPVTLLGFSPVRLEVALLALTFFFLLFCLTPFGHAALWK